jgi:diguanylate cyclase (GGDEF)-like protein
MQQTGTTQHSDSRTEEIFTSYVALAKGLVPDLLGIGVCDESYAWWGQSGDLHADRAKKWLRSLGWGTAEQRTPMACEAGADRRWTAIPIEQSDGRLLGIFCVSQSNGPTRPLQQPARLALQLKPLLDCVQRDMAASRPASAKMQSLTERSAELEWLFKITNDLRGATDDQTVVEALLKASTERLGSALGILHVPDKRLTLTCATDESEKTRLLEAWHQTQPHLMAWVQRQNRPLVINQVGASQKGRMPCKMMCVPIVRETGRVVGIMAFYNPPQAKDFVPRHVFLARHIGRQAASLVEAQFDLMTGLYTRSGLDQMFGAVRDSAVDCEQSVIYLDIDHMHVANELHGFELGNELIVRVADLLSVPVLPQDALAARISGDRFAIVLPSSSCDDAKLIAENLQSAAAKLVIGPSKDAFDVSISCGVSILLPLPDGLSRAVAAAEIACKTAKNRGRNRVEIYKFEDGSMMRRHQDALLVGQLRSALKADRLLLFAQRIHPLQNSSLAGGYELLLRLREVDGTLVAPGPLIQAAQRYQILPAIDRWVAQRALQILAPYRSMFITRELGMSINVSGQSIGDETFIQQFAQFLKEANLPRNCVSVELTEQAAITNMARAAEMVQRLGALGCRFALDDFGTGANSLTYLKSLQVYRVKIDGSFVRDILTNRNSQATVRAIVELAKGMNIETVAEYVESAEIASLLRKMGVDYAQGYAFDKPAPLEDVLRQLTLDESARLHRLFLES